MTARRIGYGATTALIALETLAGGVTDLARGRTMVVAGPPVVAVVTGLGYPAYVLTILGAWKLLGALAVLVPRRPRLKEWAYAGLVFQLTGAAASQAARRRGVGAIMPPLVFAGLALASWALRPPSRALSGAVVRSCDQSRRSGPRPPRATRRPHGHPRRSGRRLLSQTMGATSRGRR